jgi:catechol-2,3-dioxygenase
MTPTDQNREPHLVTGYAELTLQTPEPDALAEFYREVFSLGELDDDADEDGRVWLTVGDGARLGLWTPGEKEFGDEGGAHVHFAFAADDEALEEIVSRARERGAETEGPVEHDGGDRSIYVTDPEGNVVEAWSTPRK